MKMFAKNLAAAIPFGIITSPAQSAEMPNVILMVASKPDCSSRI